MAGMSQSFSPDSTTAWILKHSLPVQVITCLFGLPFAVVTAQPFKGLPRQLQTGANAYNFDENNTQVFQHG
jgi:hypothetical protein